MRPEWPQTPLLACRELGGDSGGEVWQIESSQGLRAFKRLLLRDAAIDPQRAMRLQNLAASAALAPRVLQTDVDGRWQLAEFVPGRAVGDPEYRQPVLQRQLAQRLGELHRLPLEALGDIPAHWHFDAGQHIARRWRTLARDGVSQLPEGLAARVDAALTRAQSITRQSRPPAVLHLDVHPGNLLAGSNLLLLDWDYAHIGDPVWDLASWQSQMPQGILPLSELLTVAGRAVDTTQEQLQTAIEVFRVLNELWALQTRAQFGPSSGRAGLGPAF